MSTDLDTTRIVRSWLRTDEHESAARVLDEVLAALDATPQRRSWWPARRFADMNGLAKFAIAAAAVVVIAVVGINLLPRSGGNIGGPAVTPSPSPSTAPSPTPAAFPPAGELAVGPRHSMTLEGVTFTFRVSGAGWVSNGEFGIDKSAGVGPDGAGYIFWNDAPVGVFADPCAQREGPPVGTDPADLAAAVATIPGIEVVRGPSDVTVGGYPAKHVVITIPEDIDCAANAFHLWYAPGDLGRYATAVGSTIRTWIIDVDGKIVWIDGETYKGATPPDTDQVIYPLVDSIQFE